MLRNVIKAISASLSVGHKLLVHLLARSGSGIPTIASPAVSVGVRCLRSCPDAAIAMLTCVHKGTGVTLLVA
jgi:hypothetical protein